MSEELRSTIHEPLIYRDAASDMRQSVEQEDLRERSSEHTYEPNDPCKGEGEWIVLDMLDDHGGSPGL